MNQDDVYEAAPDKGQELPGSAQVDAAPVMQSEEDQKKKLRQMKNDEYKWYKYKMIGAVVLVFVVYFIFFLLMKYA